MSAKVQKRALTTIGEQNGDVVRFGYMGYTMLQLIDWIRYHCTVHYF
jgi:hypothetical protein